MKARAIKFFSPDENVSVTKKPQEKSKPTGYISSSGKLVLPPKTLEELGIEPETGRFKIGTQQGKRTLKYLYLIPSTEEEGTFALTRSGRGYSIPLELILRKGGVDFESTKYIFEITLFNYDEGVVGFELALGTEDPKPAYTGKPRGRKPKNAVAA
jgi:hypothetical protein